MTAAGAAYLIIAIAAALIVLAPTAGRRFGRTFCRNPW